MPEATPSSPAQLVLAFDFGLRRIGVACGDTLSRTASTLNIVPAGPAGPRWEILSSLISDWQPALLVVGVPYSVDGSQNAMTRAARSFANQLRLRYSLTVHMVDERYSSLEAAARLKEARESGLRKRRVAKTDIDAAAACVILERWFIEKVEANAITTR